MKNIITLESAFKRKSTCFIPYICAGDPNYATSIKIVEALINAKVDILEIGLPFSDPQADGPTNQLASERALKNGMNLTKFFKFISEIKEITPIPIVIYTYLNPIISYGFDRFIEKISTIGIAGIIILDLPHNEKNYTIKNKNLHRINLITPSTKENRISKITKNSSAFIYYVSQMGVTGARSNLATGLQKNIEKIKKYTKLPIAVGFGISKIDHIRSIKKNADGIVVGSAIVKIIEKNPKTAPEKIYNFVEPLCIETHSR